MNGKTAKIICSTVTGSHLFLLSTIFMVGEGILFGHRHFDDVIRIFAGIEIILSSVSLFLIFKEKQIGYVLLTVSVLSTYIIQFGHRMLWWPCEYCNL
ncbi:MAG: hypothetical protein ACRBBZ_02890 [Nitrosopumilus sp.]